MPSVKLSVGVFRVSSYVQCSPANWIFGQKKINIIHYKLKNELITKIMEYIEHNKHAIYEINKFSVI